MYERPTADLTIISVVFRDTFYMQQNLELTNRLNPAFGGKWLVVDNSPPLAIHAPPGMNAKVVDGAPPPVKTIDRGSLHHALGLEKALHAVDTRFVLLLDHDLYVIRENWIAEILDHVREQGIAIFGSVWHPRWFIHYQGFPSVHFMLIDLQKIPKANVELKPLMNSDWWGRKIRKKRAPWGRAWPVWLQETLRAHRLRDTGWQFYRRYRHDRSIKVEMLMPHYIPPDTSRYRVERRFSLLLRNNWRKYPRGEGSFTRKTFLKNLMPDAYANGWEEFFWRGEPFAVHLRRVGRVRPGSDHAADEDLLLEFLLRRPSDG